MPSEAKSGVGALVRYYDTATDVSTIMHGYAMANKTGALRRNIRGIV